jgi:hypothetical protein
MSPEVLIYVQNVKNFFKHDVDARNYFLNKVDEEMFFKYLTDISQKNFEKDGEPVLTKDQFELIRKTLLLVDITKKEYDEKESLNSKIFIDFSVFGKICLN